MISNSLLLDFAEESNNIENIYSYELHLEHCRALVRFLAYKRIAFKRLEAFVKAIQPSAVFRDKPHLRVGIGGREAPCSESVIAALPEVLQEISKGGDRPEQLHQWYERLHPFTDGNGRSGRALWLWQMVHHYDYDGKYLFLRGYYYQTLGGVEL